MVSMISSVFCVVGCAKGHVFGFEIRYSRSFVLSLLGPFFTLHCSCSVSGIDLAFNYSVHSTAITLIAYEADSL